MKYILTDADGHTIGLESVKVIPPGGTIVFSLSFEVLDIDVQRIYDDLKDFFGDRKVIVIRAGDTQITYLAEESRA